MELVIASQNVHKIRELREFFKKISKYDILSLLDFPQYTPPAIDGKTFQEIATIKAEHAARALNKLVIADDSGLVVPALGTGGVPGIVSKFFAGPEATERENRHKLLKVLDGKNGLERTAYYECCLALANPESLLKSFSATCEGLIASEERGRNGFGYDSIFVKHDYEKTFGELDDSARNRISHRRKAFEKALIFLESMK